MSYIKSELLLILMSNILCIHCCTGFGGFREIFVSPFSISSKSRIFSTVSEWPDKKGTARHQAEDFLLFHVSFYKLNHSLNTKIFFSLLGIYFVAQCSIYLFSSISFAQLPILRLGGCQLLSTASFCQMELHPAAVVPFCSTMFSVSP